MAHARTRIVRLPEVGLVCGDEVDPSIPTPPHVRSACPIGHDTNVASATVAERIVGVTLLLMGGGVGIDTIASHVSNSSSLVFTQLD